MKRKEKTALEGRIQECSGVYRSSGAGRGSSRLIPRAVRHLTPWGIQIKHKYSETSTLES